MFFTFTVFVSDWYRSVFLEEFNKQLIAPTVQFFLIAIVPPVDFLQTSLSFISSESEDSTTCDSKIVRIQFVDRVGNVKQIEGKVDDNLMTLARQHNIEIEGACEASLACSTCHVYIDQKFYNQLPPASEEEEDMLDLAVFLQENSRLSCQIFLTKELDGMKVTLPRATRNFYVDGHVPQPH
ncbi:unnamed protein product [Heterobilharzia americana]|nr:unnamed protein product [Heterobilharzia americana]